MGFTMDAHFQWILAESPSSESLACLLSGDPDSGERYETIRMIRLAMVDHYHV